MNTDPTCKTSGIRAFQAPDVEKKLIGVLLSFPKISEQICELLQPEMFTESDMQILFSYANSLVSKGETPDIATIDRILKPCDKEAGLTGKMIECTMSVSSSALWEQWCLIVQQNYFKRQMYYGLIEQSSALQAPETDIFGTIDSIENLISGIEKQVQRNVSVRDFKQILDDAEKQVLRRMDCHVKGSMPGINTGLNALNSYTMGWQPQQLIILAARPAMGKTAMALSFAKTASMFGSKVVFFSLEMSDVQLSQRLILSECDLLPEAVKSGNLTQEQFKEFLRAKNVIGGLPLTVIEKGGIEINDLCRMVRSLHKQKKCDILFVDYLQLVTVGRDNRVGNREQEISRISSKLKALAKDLNIPVIALAQLSRAVESRENKRPVMSDLRESGAIEQDADIVMFLYRGEYYKNPKKEDKDPVIPGQGDISIAKNRDGEIGVSVFSYNPSMTKIRNVQEVPLLQGNTTETLPAECPF